MNGERSVHIGHDAHNNVIVTGDDNRIYVFPGITQLTAELIARIETGQLKPQDIPGAVPLPTLTLRIAFADAARSAWSVTSIPAAGPESARQVPPPWLAAPRFAAALAGFWELSRRLLQDDAERETAQAHALALGEALTQVLAPEEAALLIETARHDGPPPLLVTESAHDLVLALPWELLRLEGRYAVEEGRLDVARCVPAEGAPVLAPPASPVTLLVNVSAPEGSGLDCEAESYYISRALHDHVGLRVNEMGELDDLVAGLRGEPAPLGVHFSGHGGPGELVFEDAFGGEDPVPVARMLSAMRRAAPERFPRFFYLASCHGGDPPQVGERGGESEQAGVSSTASQLHRDGVTQVVAYFGPVLDAQSTWAEAAFYREIARGRRTRDALRAARQAMARPLIPDARQALRDTSGNQAAGLTPFAWAQLVLYQRGPDYPLGLPVPVRYAETAEAPPERVEELIPGSGRSRILHHGFVGRRRELHALRRDLRQGKQVHVVQGLGGLGKSSFCIEALKVYRRQGREALTLWCAEVEASAAPAEGLLKQLTDAGGALAGDAWDAVLAALDQAAGADPALQSPAQRFAALLAWLLEQEGQRPLALYLDNLESLLTRPDAADGLGAWRDPECAALWRLLRELAQASAGRLALLASCRYRHADFSEALFPLPRLPADTLWRLIGWFPGLRRLSRWSRERLVRRLSGHPRAVEFLDALVRDALARHEERHGDFVPAADEQEAEQEWGELIAPLLPPLAQELSEDLLFDALWERVLDDPARRLLVRATVLRRPADWDLLRALADLPEPDSAIRRLRDASLLTGLSETGPDGRRQRRFEVEASVAELARARSPESERLVGEAHRLAGDLLEARAPGSRDWNDAWEAAYHLDQAGETDRAFDLLLDLTEWLYARGRYLDGLDALAGLAAPWRLGPRNEEGFALLQGDALAGLGYLGTARAWLEHGVECLQALAAQDPSNAGWQRDLSVSYERVGDSLAAQGDLAGALEAYRESLAIREALAVQDRSDAGWETDVAVSCWKLSQALGAGSEEARALLERGLAILRDLQTESRLNTAQQGWIAAFEQALQIETPVRSTPQAPWYRRLWGRWPRPWGPRG